jgi:hypothetical protein
MTKASTARPVNVSINIILKCVHFPGIAFDDKHPVFVGVQRGKEIVDAVPGDTDVAMWTLPVQVKGGRDGKPDFTGPSVYGKPGDRFIYVVWFENVGGGERFRRAKIKLSHLTWDQVAGDIEAELTMTDGRGTPISGTVKKEWIQWPGE